MNQDDIERIASDAGIVVIGEGIVVTGEAVVKLCELVAAAEREACIKALEENEQFYCRDTIRARGETK